MSEGQDDAEEAEEGDEDDEEDEPYRAVGGAPVGRTLAPHTTRRPGKATKMGAKKTGCIIIKKMGL